MMKFTFVPLSNLSISSSFRGDESGPSSIVFQILSLQSMPDDPPLPYRSEDCHTIEDPPISPERNVHFPLFEPNISFQISSSINFLKCDHSGAPRQTQWHDEIYSNNLLTVNFARFIGSVRESHLSNSADTV